MHFGSPNEFEYDLEALTILDKMLRSDVCGRNPEDEIHVLSEKALKKYIKKAFKFWFGDQGHIDIPYELIVDLLSEYQTGEDEPIDIKAL